MKQTEISQSPIRPLAQQSRAFRRRKILMAFGLFFLGLLFLGLLITRQVQPVMAEETAQTHHPRYYRLKIDNASPARVRELLQKGRTVVIHSAEHPEGLDTIADMAAYFSFFRDRYFDAER